MTDDVTPIVTVITPTYNRAHTLRETIESVLSQDFTDFEYIILDDGSTDGTQSLLAEYDDPRLITTYHDNMGETRTVNKGFDMARGRYITIINSDDIFLPGCLRIGTEFMEANPEIIVGYPRWRAMDAKSNLGDEIPTYEYDFVTMVTEQYCLPGAAPFIRKTALALEPHRNVAYTYVGELEHYLRLGLHGPFKRIPHMLAAWRAYEGNAAYSAPDAVADERIQMMQTYYQQPNLPAEIRAVKRKAMSNAYFTAGFYHEILRKNYGKAYRFYLQSLIRNPSYRPRFAASYARSDRHMWLYITGMRRIQPTIKRARRKVGHRFPGLVRIVRRIRLMRARRILANMPRYTPGRIRAFGWDLDYVDATALVSGLKGLVVSGWNDFRYEGRDPVILDCGANIGLSVLRYKKLFPNARITAFEPDKAICDVLRRNLARNKAGDVAVVEAAVWTTDGEMDFAPEGADGSHLVEPADAATGSYRVQTVDLNTYLTPDVDFVKLDIEGAEVEVLKHSKDQLKNVKSMIVEFHHLKEDPQRFADVLTALGEAGFQTYINPLSQWLDFQQSDLQREPGQVADQYFVIYAWRAS